jgi:hypothetical protein
MSYVYLGRMHIENSNVHNITISFYFNIGVVWNCVLWAGLSVSIKIEKYLLFTIITLT